MGSEKIEGCAGVALFGKSQEADLAAFKWAYKHLPVSDKYKLRIIHVNELANQTRERPDLRYGHDVLQIKFRESFPPDCKIGQLQTDIREIKKYISGVTYEGENFEKALQLAINNLRKDERLDTLVLGWSVADDTNGPPVTINRLESEGYSIVLAKVDSKKLTFCMPPPTQTSFGLFWLALPVAGCFLAYYLLKSFFSATASHAATPSEAKTKTFSLFGQFVCLALAAAGIIGYLPFFAATAGHAETASEAKTDTLPPLEPTGSASRP